MIKNKTLLDKLEVVNSMQKDSTTRYENAITILNSHNSF